MSVDGGRTGTAGRDTEQAITALKKGAYLLKYGRRGKPKFCPFRLSNDESVLIWYSGKEEKHLKLGHVSRIMPGQRTAIFQRYPRPEKECQSFSLIYNDRSLDLICKDKDEAEVWFAGLRALISRSHQRKWKIESRSGGISSGTNSPRAYTRSSPLSSPFGSDSVHKDGSDLLYFRSPHESPPKNGSDKACSDVILYSVPPKGFFPSDSAGASVYSSSSGASDGINGHMRGPVDNYRVSLSSAVSSSSQGSGQDDGDALGDVFIWGEGIGEGVLGGGTQRVGNSSAAKIDSLVPKALESAVILDAQYIACGGRHAEPRELNFVFELKKQSSCLVQLTNNTNHYTAFKVKTTSPKRYCVRPNAGIVLPKSIFDVTVTLQPQRVTPSDMQCRDKFLVQSTVVPYGTTEEEIKPELFSKESGKFIENCKLRVVFLMPPHSPMLQQFKGSFKREMSFKETSFEAPNLKEATVLEEIPVRESLVLKKSPVLKETEVVPILKEASVLKESPLLIEAQVLKEAHLLNDQESTRAENICPSHVAKDVEELGLKLCHLQSRLNESEKINTILREEKSLAVLEKDKLQKELMILRTKSIARMQVGYPILFVCFIGLVGVVLGYLLHR